MKKNNRKTGSEKEELAAAFLSEAGFEILERNFRTRYGEIDIIAKEGQTLVFVEVKYRSGDGQGTPEMAVDGRKQAKISKVALFYYASHGYGDGVPCRFDVVAIYGDGKIIHYKDAFYYRR